MPLHNKQIYNRNLKRKSHSVLDKGYTLIKSLKTGEISIGIWKGVHCHAEKVELFFKHRYWFIHRNFYWVRNL